MKFNHLTGFRSAAERIKTERESRIRAVANTLPFGITFLDRALRGATPEDIVLLGAYPGAGKTELATHIALTNAANGKRVHYFALEAVDGEIERRMKYKLLVQAYRLDSSPSRRIVPNFQDWMYNDYEDVFSRYEEKVDLMIGSLTNLNTFYRKGDFGEREFEQVMNTLDGQSDVVIIDHLHFFDLEDENENRAVGGLLKKIRDLSLLNRVPTFLIAHLRKADKRAAQLCPDLSDFQGTSNIGKIVTKAVLLSSGGVSPSNPNHFYTYMRIGKNRIDGSRTNYVARVTWNASANIYEEDFAIGKLSADGKEFIPIDKLDSVPAWLRGGAA